VSERERIVRESIDAWNANDWERMEALWDPAGEIIGPREWPESGSFRGWPAIRGQFERLKGSWTEERLERISLESHADRVLVHVRWLGTGEASGLATELDVWWVNEVRDSLLRRAVYFLTDEESARNEFRRGVERAV
jgi:ketosteroid isomerase-like protein